MVVDKFRSVHKITIMFRGLCQALFSVMRRGELLILTNHRRVLSYVLRSDWSIRWLENDWEFIRGEMIGCLSGWWIATYWSRPVVPTWAVINKWNKSRYFGVQLEIEIKDLDNIFDVGARFLLKCFSLLIFISCIDFHSDTNPGTGCEFSVLLWSKALSLRFKFWNWTKLNNRKLRTDNIRTVCKFSGWSEHKARLAALTWVELILSWF